MRKTGGQKPFGIPKLRFEDNIKMDVRGMGLEGGLGWPQNAGCCEHDNEPWGSIKRR